MSVSQTENQTANQPTSQPISQSVSQSVTPPDNQPPVRPPVCHVHAGSTEQLSCRPDPNRYPAPLAPYVTTTQTQTSAFAVLGVKHAFWDLRYTFCRVWKISFAVWCSINCKFSSPVCESTQLLSPGYRFSLLYRKHGCSRFPEKLVNSVRLHGFIQESTLLQNHRACYWTVLLILKKNLSNK